MASEDESSKGGPSTPKSSIHQSTSSKKGSKQGSDLESKHGSEQESKKSSRESKKESVRESKTSQRESAPEGAKIPSLASKRQKVEKTYDLDRDSFSKGIDPRDPEGKDLDVLVRIQKPLTWLRLASGVRIIDLHEDHYDGVLSIMRGTFLREEALCKSLRLWEDEESVESLLGSCTLWMRDGCSIAAVQEGSNELLGALILRVVTLLDHTRTFSRIRLVQGEGYQKIITFRCQLHKKADVFDRYDVSSYLRIYAICVRPSHRGKGIGMALLQSAMLVGAALGQRIVMGIITTAQMQAMCAKLGMHPIHEVYYAQWIQDGQVVFDDPGPGNYSAIVMCKRLPRIAEF